MRAVGVFVLFLVVVTAATPPQAFSNSSDISQVRVKRDAATTGTNMEAFGASMLGFIASVSLVLMVVFGRFMEDVPIRWQVLNVGCLGTISCLWMNNCLTISPMASFLKDDFIDLKCIDAKRIVLSTFYLGMVFVTPATFLIHFAPSVKKWPIMRFYIWIPLFFALDLFVLIIYLAEPSVDVTKYTDFRMYHFIVTVVNYVFLFISFILTLCCLVKWFVYSCQYCCNATSEIVPQMWDTLNMLLYFVYLLISTIIRAPANDYAMGLWIFSNYASIIFQMIPSDLLMQIMSGGGGSSSSGGMSIMDLLNLFLQIVDIFALIWPFVDFIVTVLCVPMFRWQMLHIVSCGQAGRQPLKRIRRRFCCNGCCIGVGGSHRPSSSRSDKVSPSDIVRVPEKTPGTTFSTRSTEIALTPPWKP